MNSHDFEGMNGFNYADARPKVLPTDEEMEIAPDLIGLNVHDDWQTVTSELSKYRPSTLRITTGHYVMNNQPWRVTIIVDDDATIQSITQEVLTYRSQS